MLSRLSILFLFTRMCANFPALPQCGLPLLCHVLVQGHCYGWCDDSPNSSHGTEVTILAVWFQRAQRSPHARAPAARSWQHHGSALLPAEIIVVTT